MPTQLRQHRFLALHVPLGGRTSKLLSISGSFILQAMFVMLVLLPSVAQNQKSSYRSYEVIRITHFPVKLASHPRTILASDIEEIRSSPQILMIRTVPRPLFARERRANTDIQEPTVGPQVRTPSFQLSIRSITPQKPPVELGTLTSETLIDAKVRKPIAIETGTFGDPEGIKPGRASEVRRAIAQTGEFDAVEGSAREKRAPVSSAGRNVRLLTDFGDDPQGISNVRRHTPVSALPTTAFDDTNSSGLSAPTAKQRGESHPVEILSKPNPVYSDEARRLRIEGLVILETEFPLDGHVRVLRVIRSVGHGLDEAAIKVAQAIIFKPGIANGIPFVFQGIVQVQFQLAF